MRTFNQDTASGSDHQKRSVCHLITSLARGGAETQLYRFVTDDTSNVIHTVCYLGYDDAMASQFRDAGVRVRSLGGTSKIDAPLLLGRLIRFLQAHNFDILHNHQVHAMMFGRIAARVTGTKPVVSTHHNIQSAYSSLFKRLEARTRSLDSVTTGVSNGVVQSFASEGASTPHGNWTVVHNSIDIEKFRNNLADAASRTAQIRDRFGIGDESLVFLNVGRYVPQKNQVRLIEAMEKMIQDDPESHLFIVGWGSLNENLQMEVTQRGLESNVHVTGRVETIEEYYCLADSFVLPSHWEGLSIASIEALAASLPIIGTDVPGVREVVEDGKNGYLVTPDSASALAKAMTALRSEKRRAQLGDASSRLVRDRYSLQAMISSYLSLYNQYR